MGQNHVCPDNGQSDVAQSNAPADTELEAIFDEGVQAADAEIGSDNDDYNRVLGGVSAVLKAKGLNYSRRRLAERFHDPLAMFTPQHSLAQIGQAMDWRLQNQAARPGYDTQSLLDRRSLLPYIFEGYVGTLDNEFAMRDRLSSMERQMKPGADGLCDQLNRAESRVLAMREQAQIAAALVGDDAAGIVAIRQQADAIEATVAQKRQWAVQRITEVKSKIDGLPVERAEQLQPLHTLKPSIKHFQGNLLENGPLVSDGFVILNAEAMDDKQTAKVRGKAHPKRASQVKQAEADKLWRQFLAQAQTEAILVGHRQGVAYFVPRDGDNGLAHVNADTLRFLQSATDFDRVMIGQDTAASWVVLYRGDTPVACLSNSEGTVRANWLDIPTARRVAASFPPPEAQPKRGNKTRVSEDNA
jgi:hypothetical protein